MQLYIHPESKLAVVQIRSGLLPGKGGVFLSDLFQWSKEKNIARLVCLTSSHAHERSDVQLRGSPLRFLTSSALEKENPVPENFTKMETKRLLKRRGCREKTPRGMRISQTEREGGGKGVKKVNGFLH